MKEKEYIVTSLKNASARAVEKEWKPASDKQIYFIASLVMDGHLSSEDVAIKDGFCLTSSSASKLINAGLEAKNKPVVVTEEDDDNIPF